MGFAILRSSMSNDVCLGRNLSTILDWMCVYGHSDSIDKGNYANQKIIIKLSSFFYSYFIIDWNRAKLRTCLLPTGLLFWGLYTKLFGSLWQGDRPQPNAAVGDKLGCTVDQP